MIFWIVVGIIAVVILGGVFLLFADRLHRPEDTLFPALGFSALIAVVAFIVIGTGATMSAVEQPPHKSETYGLRAVLTKETQETSFSGSYFLVFGGVSGGTYMVKDVSFIQTAEDGGNTLQKVSIDSSVIYEDLKPEETPYVEYWTTEAHASWVWVPWETIIYESVEYRFHIPAGSIYEGYEILP